MPMYQPILNQTKPDLTIPNQTKFPLIAHNSVIFHARSSKFFMIVHLDNVHVPAYFNPLVPTGTLKYLKIVIILSVLE